MGKGVLRSLTLPAEDKQGYGCKDPVPLYRAAFDDKFGYDGGGEASCRVLHVCH